MNQQTLFEASKLISSKKIIDILTHSFRIWTLNYS